MSSLNAPSHIKNILLVHGAFVGGSGWQSVYQLLQQQGYHVAVMQNPTLSLADDVARTKDAIAAMQGPVLLVGHSYGGAVITEAGNDPKVKGLVYIAAFVPDAGESVKTLVDSFPSDAPHAPIIPAQDGFVCLDKQKFAASFADDIPSQLADFIAASQIPWGLAALTGTVTVPSWKTKPSWYLVAKDDKMIPALAQQQMANRAGALICEVSGSHAVYISQSEAVAALIAKASQL
jgi:pimeloyl-ACP methyl ester carboxylesterase